MANHHEDLTKIAQEGFSTVEQLHVGDLVKIGREGFSTVEQLYGGGRWPENLPPTHKIPPYQKWGNEAPRTIDCNEAAKKYGGLVMIAHE